MSTTFRGNPNKGSVNTERVVWGGFTWVVAFELGHDSWVRDLYEERRF